MMMNLCLINPSKSQRPEIHELAKHLPKKHNVIILQPSSGGEESERLTENIYVKYVPSCSMPFQDSLVTIPIFKRWIEILLDLISYSKCDIIHVCDYEYPTSILPIFIKQRFDVPILIVNDSLIGVGEYSFGSPIMDFLSKIYTYGLGARILQSYDKVIVLYSKLAEEAEKLRLPQGKIEIIPNGIDVKKAIEYQTHFKFSGIKEKYGIANDEKIILYVGRLVKMKRVEVIFKMTKKLMNQGIKVKALIVGDGPQRGKLGKMTYSIRNNIVFTGFLSEERYECYSISDLFILPSLSEGLPTVLLEAASFGLPIVATNTGGIPDIVIHGKTGFLASRWNYDQYVNYAEYLLTDQSLARKIGENARKRVANNFSWDKVARKYEKVYDSLSDKTQS